MSTRNSLILFLALTTFSALLMLYQHKQVEKVSSVAAASIDRVKSLEEYLLDSFDVSSREGDNESLSLVFSRVHDSTCVFYLPAGLCRACFSSLIFACQDYGIDWSRLEVLSEDYDPEVRAECLSRGIRFQVVGQQADGIEDIVIGRLYQGYLPVAMKYNLEYESILGLFFSDNSYIRKTEPIEQ